MSISAAQLQELLLQDPAFAWESQELVSQDFLLLPPRRPPTNFFIWSSDNLVTVALLRTNFIIRVLKG